MYHFLSLFVCLFQLLGCIFKCIQLAISYKVFNLAHLKVDIMPNFFLSCDVSLISNTFTKEVSSTVQVRDIYYTF